MVDIFRKRSPKKTVKTSWITVLEWVLAVLLLIVFWKDILHVATGLVDWWFPRANLAAPEDIITSLIILLTAFMAFFIVVVLFLFSFTRKAGFPVFSYDDLRHHVALEDDDWEQEHGANFDQQEPVTPDYLENTNPSDHATERNSPPSQPIAGESDHYPLLHHFIFGRLEQIFSGTLLQLMWFFGLRGMNVVIRRGTPLSADLGRQYSHIISSVASDFDSGFVLDSPQDEGDRRHSPPITGWYGLRFTFRRGLRGSARLDRITRTEKGVTAFTSDGIEVEADVVANFILGQRPETIEVAYLKPNLEARKPYTVDDLRIVRSREEREPYPGISIQTEYKDALDAQDAHFVHSMLRSLLNESGDHHWIPAPNQYAPEFNRGRVFRAISSSTVTARGDEEEWESLPLHYAKEVFHTVLLNYSYDDLFGDVREINGEEYPVDAINAEIRRRVRNSAVLGFRLLWHQRSLSLPDTVEGEFPYRRDRVLCAPNRSHTIDTPQYYVEFPPEPIKGSVNGDSKLLRARGIKVFNAQFENLRPRHAEIEQIRTDAWGATWERDANFVRAETERECIQIMNQAGVITQREMGENLLRIFESGNPDEVVMMQIISSLQSLVNRQDIQNFLPRDVNTMLGNIERWWKE
ncbi:MAG: hypothetical protein HPY85_11330 [Anaerolineae bacterium]|nr:hypothetical protein [Anaerolineae bacterium]